MSTSLKAPAKPAIKAVRGTRDLLPDQTLLWNQVEATARAVFARYAFGEIRTPIFESMSSLFARGRWARKPTSSPKRCSPGRIARAPPPKKLNQLTLRPENPPLA